MEPTLLVVGVNRSSAPLAMRERFWLGENRRYEVLRQLKCAEGIEEVVILSTCCRTEFIVWASEATLAANSLLHFLGSNHSLKLSEWEHFYRLLGEAAFSHIFRVTCGLDSIVLGEQEITAQIKAAWEQARTVGAVGRFLSAVLDKALDVTRQVREETAIEQIAVSIPTAMLAVSHNILGSLEGRRIVLIGASKVSAMSARLMIEDGDASVVVIDQSPTCAAEMAQTLGGTAANLSDRSKCMLAADIVITSSGCPHVILTQEEAERIAIERNRVPLLILDIGMPRDVDPEVRRVDGILLYDIDGLEHAVKNYASHHSDAAVEAERIVASAAHDFRSQLQAESVVPTIVALRHRLDEICRQELESFIEERGPFTREQDQSLHAVTSQVIRKIASSLARELKELPEREEQEQMTAVVTRLFHLESPQTALAGTKLENQHERRKEQRVALI